MSFEMPLEEDLFLSEEEVSKNYEILTESSLIPTVGSYLGLDISESSSGICLYRDGKKLQANISLETKDTEEFYEVKLRRELKQYLSEFINGQDMDLVIIEDAYQGMNPNTTRKLYALNTAIDELILDGDFKCKKFLRVSNKTWKSWLFRVDAEGCFKGLNDKERIRRCLELLGVHEEGEGYQDRLDSCGLLLGYFFAGEPEKKEKQKVSMTFSDLCFEYQEDEDFISQAVRSERQVEDLLIKRVDVGQKSWTKQLIMSLIKDSPEYVVITSQPIKLGNLGVSLGINSIFGNKGFFGFWVKRSKFKKLNIEEGDK